MKKEIIFATNNAHKLQEIKQIIGDQYHVRSLSEIGFTGDIPETAPTIAGNALQKAKYIYERYGLDCFADDTGLEVEALDGAPGVFSARYAGPGCSYADNVNKLLDALKQHQNRKARFVTVIALIIAGKEMFFEGEVQGQIIGSPRGNGGFGYDPVFLPKDQNLTFAEMDAGTKNSISHRGLAVRKLIAYLTEKEN